MAAGEALAGWARSRCEPWFEIATGECGRETPSFGFIVVRDWLPAELLASCVLSSLGLPAVER